MKDRVRSGAAAEPTTEPAAGPDVSPAPSAECPAKQCWISLPVDGSTPRAGLLLEWRRVEMGRIEGLVIYSAQLRTGRWSTVTEWVPAELLSPAG